MGALSSMRNLSAAILLLIVLRGAITIDGRFTMLLMPPFLMYYSSHTPDWVEHLPMVHWLNKQNEGLIDFMGFWPSRIFLAAGGAMLGLWAVGEYNKYMEAPAAAPA